MTVENGVKHWTFISTCPSAKCGRKIRVRYYDNHVWEVKTIDDPENPGNTIWSAQKIEGQNFPDTDEGRAHKAYESTLAFALADQYHDWMLGLIDLFAGVELPLAPLDPLGEQENQT